MARHTSGKYTTTFNSPHRCLRPRCGELKLRNDRGWHGFGGIVIRRCFPLCLLLSTVGPHLWAAPSPQLVVEAPVELTAVAEEVRSIGDGDFSAGLHITGVIGFTRPIRVVLLAENSELAHEVPAWVSGFARGSDALIVLFPARVHSYPDRNLRTLVHHEVAHVLVAQAARGRPVPRWFNEGVATVAARDTASATSTPSSRAAVHRSLEPMLSPPLLSASSSVATAPRHRRWCWMAWPEI